MTKYCVVVEQPLHRAPRSVQHRCDSVCIADNCPVSPRIAIGAPEIAFAVRLPKGGGPSA